MKKLRLFNLAYDINWGPAHENEWAFGEDFEDALIRFKKKFADNPGPNGFPDTDGYQSTYNLNLDKIWTELGEAFRMPEDKLHEKYKK